MSNSLEISRTKPSTSKPKIVAKKTRKIIDMNINHPYYNRKDTRDEEIFQLKEVNENTEISKVIGVICCDSMHNLVWGIDDAFLCYSVGNVVIKENLKNREQIYGYVLLLI